VFIAQAHSFTQQARLAITLAWVAGYTNILAILTCGHVISHVSGTTSDLGRYAVEGSWGPAFFLLFLLLTFLLGAGISGLTTEVGKRRGWESIYVLPMVVEAVLLAGFAALVNTLDPGDVADGWRRFLMTGLASAAMGLQNATITRISSGVVRTTHVTGVLTDLGTELVQFGMFLMDRRGRWRDAGVWIRSLHRHIAARRLALLASILGSFALGAGLGTLVHAHAPGLSMTPPVFFLLWVIAQDLRVPIAEIEPAEIVGASGLSLPPEMAVYHMRRDSDRPSHVQRLPDLMSWMDRLPETARVVVLDLDQVTQMDPDSAMELRAVLKKMADQGRHLILAGITPGQFKELSRAGGNSLDPMSACPDVELAIARGLGLLG
jgi:uncharacterized membrane protein YoaK (UPF0700 family)